MAKRVVMLLSGGLDSMTAMAELISQPVTAVERIIALIVDYGQSSLAEVENAVKLCECWRVPYMVHKTKMPSDTDTKKEIPARNLALISYAASVAIQNHFNTIGIGFEPDSTYTDSSVEFTERANHLLDLFDLELVTPVKQLANKRALIVRALELGVPLHLCHSSRTNKVDGNCKTSKLFLESLRTLFPLEPDPTKLLAELGKLRCIFNSEKNTYTIKYASDLGAHSFKYAAALFAVASNTLWDHKIQVYSTGSWMHDLKLVASKYNKHDYFEFHKTNDLNLLINQEWNPSEVGIKQALSLLPRPRYIKGLNCAVTQGRLGSALYELGYNIGAPACHHYPTLDTYHCKS